MATKALTKPRKPGRPKNDKRRHNRGVVGNKGGRKEWRPEPVFMQDRKGVVRKQTQDEAWEAARAYVRHMAAHGVPQEIMGQFLKPKIMDEGTLKKHFAWEVEHGALQADLQITGVLFSAASRGDLGTARWWAERRVPGFQLKVDVNIKTPIPIQTLPGDEGL